MSSLFGSVNSIRPFSILLYIYTLFYHVLYFAILTRHFRLLWWCFALLICIWLCKVLYPIAQFYILLRRSSKIGWLSKFLYSVLRSHIMMFHPVNRSCIMRTSYRAWHPVEKKLDDRAGEWLSFSATLSFLPSAVKMADNVDKTDP